MFLQPNNSFLAYLRVSCCFLNCRVDFSAHLSHEARRSLALNMQKGDACMDLALAALQIAAEDDALGGSNFEKLNYCIKLT